MCIVCSVYCTCNVQCSVRMYCLYAVYYTMKAVSLFSMCVACFAGSLCGAVWKGVQSCAATVCIGFLCA